VVRHPRAFRTRRPPAAEPKFQSTSPKVTLKNMSPNAPADDHHDDIMYPSAIPFLLVHLG
jgi:hypothetical protein